MASFSKNLQQKLPWNTEEKNTIIHTIHWKWNLRWVNYSTWQMIVVTCNDRFTLFIPFLIWHLSCSSMTILYFSISLYSTMFWFTWVLRLSIFSSCCCISCSNTSYFSWAASISADFCHRALFLSFRHFQQNSSCCSFVSTLSSWVKTINII